MTFLQGTIIVRVGSSRLANCRTPSSEVNGTNKYSVLPFLYLVPPQLSRSILHKKGTLRFRESASQVL